MLKKILPVAIGLVLILLIAVTVNGVKKSTNRTPAISDGNKVYLSYNVDSNKYDITNERLYNYLKKNNGTATLLNMVDKMIYADELAAFTANDDFNDYVVEQLFGTKEAEEIDNDEEKMESWNELLTSFRLSGILTKVETEAMKFADKANFTLAAVKALANFSKVADEYKLGYVRNEWAKGKILENYIKDNKTTEADPVNDEAVNEYYKNNYKKTVNGMYIAFQSEKEAKAAMKAVGINTTSAVLSNNDVWIKDSYDYYTDYSVEDEDKYTLEEAVNMFVQLYNMTNNYQGKSLDYASAFKKSLWNKQTATAVYENYVEEIKNITFGTSFKLADEVTVTLKDFNDQDLNMIAKITMELTDDSKKVLDEENGVYTGKTASYSIDSNNKATLGVTVKYTVELYDVVAGGENKLIEDVKYSSTQTITLNGTNTGSDSNKNRVIEKSATANEFPATFTSAAIYGVDFINPTEEFVFSDDDANAINATVASYLSQSSTNLVIEDCFDDSTFYTVSPVAVGDYYFLMLKLSDNELLDLYTKDDDKKLVVNEKYENSADVIAEIKAKVIEELYSDNNINDVLYQNRKDHNLKIYDKYLDALYEYSYNYFYETTLGKSDFPEYKSAKHNQKSNVASITLNTGKDKKKDYTYISADKLFGELTDKYGVSSAASLMENFIVLSDTKFNNIYNPYTNKVLNNNLVKSLLRSETSYQQKYFEQNLFSKDYAYYYQYTGIVPNFPSKYGWSDFERDYFGAYSDYEFLTSSSVGGTIYVDATKDYLKNLYMNSDISAYVDASLFAIDVPTLQALVNKARTEFYGGATTNLIVELDYNNDGTATGEEENWDKAGVLDAAKDLANLMYTMVDYTTEDDLTSQLEALVALYKEAALTTEALNSSNDPYAADFNAFGYYKYNYGFKVIVQSYDYDAEANYVDEYNEATKTLYEQVKLAKPELLGTTLDNPVVGDPFTTTYGVHKIALTATEKLGDAPDFTLVNTYILKKAYEEAKESYDSAVSSLDSNTDPTYTKIAEARVEVAKYELDKAEANFKAVIGDTAVADYKFDSDVQEAFEAWIDDAITSIESSNLLSMSYVTRLKAGTVTGNASDKFADFLEIFVEECSHEHND